MVSAPARTFTSDRAFVLTTVTLALALILASTDLLVPAISVLLLVFAGVLFGVLLAGISGFLSKHTGLSYRYAFLLVALILIVLLTAGFYYLGSQVVQRADELWSQLTSSMDAAREQASQYKIVETMLPEQTQMNKMLAQQSGTAIKGLLSGIQSVGAAITGAFVIFFVGLYAAYEPDLYRTGIIKLVPLKSRERALDVLDQLNEALTRWIIGRMASMSIVGVLTAVGLYFIDVPLPITLGVIAALLTFIPNFGPLLAAVPQVLLALNVGSNTAMYVIVLNLVLQGIESYLITPLIQRHEVTLPPILTIAAQLLMGVLIGVVGIMMAAPLVVVMMVLIQMLYIHDRLGDQNPGELAGDD